MRLFSIALPDPFVATNVTNAGDPTDKSLRLNRDTEYQTNRLSMVVGTTSREYKSTIFYVLYTNSVVRQMTGNLNKINRINVRLCPSRVKMNWKFTLRKILTPAKDPAWGPVNREQLQLKSYRAQVEMMYCHSLQVRRASSKPKVTRCSAATS